MGRPVIDLDANPGLFWDRVLVGDGCWEWQAGRFNTGYGSTRYRKRTMPASRVAWALAYGELPARDEYVCHRCDNPSCCRPDHLFLGTNQKNQEDARDKGRLNPWNAGWTHCRKGHSYEDAYTWKGKRFCRPCALAAQRAYKARRGGE